MWSSFSFMVYLLITDSTTFNSFLDGVRYAVLSMRVGMSTLLRELVKLVSRA